MKLVHFADLHLDAAFAWAGATGAAGRKRRAALRRTLERIVELAVAERADALLCAGDLYENERLCADTGEFLRATFAAAAPLRVFLAPGNHDWLGPASAYARVAWSPNVHVFRAPRLEPVDLAPGLTLWGAAHLAPAGTRGFLEEFAADRPGVNLALFHGSERAAFLEQGGAKSEHAPFAASDVARAGLRHAFVGHFHRPKDAAEFTYPGNPDPLEFGEDGPRGVVIADVARDGSVTRERRTVAETRVHDLAIDLDGCAHREDARARVRTALADLCGVARVRLCGEVAASLELSRADLDAELGHLDAAVVRFELHPAFDLDAIAQETTVRGAFVRAVRAAPLDPERRRKILLSGLRAFDERRSDLEVT
jgi:DNA repair exonuclease SbcCD nuclease subunit